MTCCQPPPAPRFTSAIRSDFRPAVLQAQPRSSPSHADVRPLNTLSASGNRKQLAPHRLDLWSATTDHIFPSPILPSAPRTGLLSAVHCPPPFPKPSLTPPSPPRDFPATEPTGTRLASHRQRHRIPISESQIQAAIERTSLELKFTRSAPSCPLLGLLSKPSPPVSRARTAHPSATEPLCRTAQTL